MGEKTLDELLAEHREAEAEVAEVEAAWGAWRKRELELDEWTDRVKTRRRAARTAINRLLGLEE